MSPHPLPDPASDPTFQKVTSLDMTIAGVDLTIDKVRVASRSISPPWGPIRFRPAPRTYAPWGCIVRVVSKTKSGKYHPKYFISLFREQGTGGVSNLRFGPTGTRWQQSGDVIPEQG